MAASASGGRCRCWWKWVWGLALASTLTLYAAVRMQGRAHLEQQQVHLSTWAITEEGGGAGEMRLLCANMFGKSPERSILEVHKEGAPATVKSNGSTDQTGPFVKTVPHARPLHILLDHVDPGLIHQGSGDKNATRRRREALRRRSKQTDTSEEYNDEDDRKQKKIDFTFSDPAEYKGPIVEGWPPDKSRHLPDYLNPEEGDDFLLSPSWSQGSMVEPTSVLFVVHSAPRFFEQRRAIRDTWGAQAAIRSQQPPSGGRNSSLVFLLGLTDDRDVEAAVVEEHMSHDDVLVAPFHDHYNNLTLKSMFTLKFVAVTKWRTPPEYLFKVDDDTYVNVSSMWDLLREIKQNDLPLGDFVAGKLLAAPARPRRVPKKARKQQFTEKWVCPTYMFNGPLYPRVVSGSGYLMTNGAAACIYNEVMKLPFFHLEDVLIVGFGSQECGLPVVGSDAFKNNPTRRAEVKSSDVALHYKSPSEMRVVFKMLTYENMRVAFNSRLEGNVMERKLALTGHDVFGSKFKDPTIRARGSRRRSVKKAQEALAEVPDNGAHTTLLQSAGQLMRQVCARNSDAQSFLLLRDVLLPTLEASLHWPRPIEQ